MDKIIEPILGLIEILVITGFLGFAGAKGLETLHSEMRRETIKALSRPTPSLSQFTQKLTK